MEVLVDCSFWGVMNADERVRLCKQLKCAVLYDANRRGRGKADRDSMSLRLVGFDDRIKQLARSLAIDTSSWRVEEEGLESVLAAEASSICGRIVYLVPDEDAEPLMGLREGDRLIVGGNVDRPLRANEASSRAAELGGRVVRLRLPIPEATGLPTEGMGGADREGATVLSVNAAVCTLLHFAESRDWKAAIARNLPKRLRHLVPPR